MSSDLVNEKYEVHDVRLDDQADETAKVDEQVKVKYKPWNECASAKRNGRVQGRIFCGVDTRNHYAKYKPMRKPIAGLLLSPWAKMATD